MKKLLLIITPFIQSRPTRRRTNCELRNKQSRRNPTSYIEPSSNSKTKHEKKNTEIHVPQSENCDSSIKNSTIDNKLNTYDSYSPQLGHKTECNANSSQYKHIRSQSIILNTDQDNNTNTFQTPFNANQRHGACSPEPESMSLPLTSVPALPSDSQHEDSTPPSHLYRVLFNLSHEPSTRALPLSCQKNEFTVTNTKNNERTSAISNKNFNADQRHGACSPRPEGASLPLTSAPSPSSDSRHED